MKIETATGIKRDLIADLAICAVATVDTPWTYWADGVHNKDGDIVADVFCNRAATLKFITESSEGWPDAIRRAIAAEAEVESLRIQRESLESTLQHYRGYA